MRSWRGLFFRHRRQLSRRNSPRRRLHAAKPTAAVMAGMLKKKQINFCGLCGEFSFFARIGFQRGAFELCLHPSEPNQKKNPETAPFLVQDSHVKQIYVNRINNLNANRSVTIIQNAHAKRRKISRVQPLFRRFGPYRCFGADDDAPSASRFNACAEWLRSTCRKGSAQAERAIRWLRCADTYPMSIEIARTHCTR